ncbi:unnamed protein product [Clonostachys rosea f. rosea IK726]|uniref:Ribosome assembly factor mrt4 n=2 Tax=Bionectria ochroleuca TaxID=29856 RepID=A0A0B7JQ50_BIOOC|nr:unnamed protein product [Clonostachys rosea f. rosea IK726]
MPKSKRSKVVHMTQVSKKTRDQKEQLFKNIRDAVPEYQHVFVFSVDNMRNSHLKDVRRELSDCRIFFGKTKLMAKALGHDAADALAPGTEDLSKYLSGTVGLILTNRPAQEILDHLSTFAPPELRRLGVPTKMVKGKIVLGEESGEGEAYSVCKEGDILDSRQTRLLKLFNVCLSEFKVNVLAYWSSATGEVTEVNPSAMEE